MRTFVQKPKTTQQTKSANSTKPGRLPSGQSREVRFILHLQRTIGNQAVQRLLRVNPSILHLQRTIGNQAVQRYLKAKTEDLEASATSNTSTAIAYDFSRVPVYPERVQRRNANDKVMDTALQGGITIAGTELRGTTTPNFTFPYHLENDRCEPATGCSGCIPQACVRCSGSLVVTYQSSPIVRLPTIPPRLRRTLRPCQLRIVQDAINNILAPHERQHEAALNTYNGTTRRPYDITGCRSEIERTIREMVSTEEQTRRSAALTLHHALDPFNPTINIDCED